MIYFTYKLRNGNPPKEKYDPQIDLGHCDLPDGTILGYTTKQFLSNVLDLENSAFTPQEIADGQIVEITQEQCQARWVQHGMIKPTLTAEGKFKPSNPPYVEKRGIDYVRTLEAEVVKTAPEKVEPEPEAPVVK